MAITPIPECIDALEKMRPGLAHSIPGYIFHIRFPHFKNITPNTQVDFSFPVTALVGANGSGKTSVLHALYGAPNRYSTGDFWFSTVVDPIVEGDGSPNRYIYGHFNKFARGIVETRKARVRKVVSGVENPNYWEPTKLAPGDGMEELPAVKAGQVVTGLSSDRWNPVRRKVIYINFRKELSAFDKYFYFGHDPDLTKLRKKQDLIRRDAEILQRLIDVGDTSYEWRNKKVALENRKLKKEELEWVSFILERPYKSAQYIRHKLFKGKDGLSVRFETDFGKYSEAFAGSGEVAVTSVVVQVLKAKAGDLVLLDEPEVSLHPGAQERLLNFLLDKAREIRVQVIFSTHAPAMLAPLPDDAIKVFTQDTTGTFSVIPQSHPYAAFRRLGVREGGEIRVLVEDRLAQYVVELARSQMAQEDRDRIAIEYQSGGAAALIAHTVPVVMHNGNATFFLLDGDQRKVDQFTDPDTVPAAEYAGLSDKLLAEIGHAPFFTPDGNAQGANNGQLQQLQLQYLSFVRGHLQYLPFSCPEAIVLSMYGDRATAEQLANSGEAKAILKSWADETLGEDAKSADVDAFGRLRLADKKNDCAALQEIAAQLKAFINTVYPG